MPIYDNLLELIRNPSGFELSNHININKIDSLVRKNIVIIVSEHISFKSHGGGYIIRDLLVDGLTFCGYETIFIDDPKEFFTIVNKNICRISFIFVFQSIMDIGWLYDKNIIDMYTMFDRLKDFEIGRYPKNIPSLFFNSKVYYKMMEDHYPQFAMPKSQTVFYPVWDEIFYEEYEKKILTRLDELKELGHNTAVLKKGFSGEKHGRRFIRLTGEIEEYKKVIKSLEYTDDMDMYTKNGPYDKGGFRIVIIQPFNKVIARRENEYKMWYLNKKFTGMYHVGSKTILYHHDTPLFNKLKSFGDDVVNVFVKDLCGEIPDILRVDVSWVTKESLLTDNIIEIDGQKRRLYLNEIEIQPTFFFKNIIHHHDGKKEYTDKYQREVCRTWLIKLYEHTDNSKILDVIKKL